VSPSNQSKSKISGGAIAGIVIGSLAAVALAGLLIFCCCYPRRRRDDEPNNENEKDLNRTTSVLSKVGLMRKRGDSVATATYRTPELDGSTPVTQQQRTPTLPQYVDNRLNPNIPSFSVNSRGEPPRQGYGPTGAAGQGLGIGSLGGRHGNGSQGSLGSIQDHVDYSRPLEVRNPDLADD
jgi:hypothetical protein